MLLRRRCFPAFFILPLIATLIVLSGGLLRTAVPLNIEKMRAGMPKWEVPAGLDRYDVKLRHVFAEAYATDVDLRCFVTGGLSESMLFMRGNEMIQLSTKPGVSVWDHELLELVMEGKISELDRDGKRLPLENTVRHYAKVPLNLDVYPLERISRQISPDLRETLRTVWLDALQHAKSGQGGAGVDGATCTYFLRTKEAGGLAGNIWSPETGPARALNTVAYHAGIAVFYPGEESRKDLENAMAAYWKAAAGRTDASLELERQNDDRTEKSKP